MTSNPVKTTAPPAIAVIGAGLMGAGLARLFSRLQWPVAVFDPDARALDLVAKESPSARIETDLRAAASGADLVIEAAPERLPLKQRIFSELAAMTPETTLLATNSSVIPVGDIAALTPDPQAARVFGAHFWNPPDIIPLVEIIQSPRTSIATIAAAREILEAAGKEAVHVKRDVVPGNRLQQALWREAMSLVDEGVCSPQDVDQIIKRSFGLRLPVLGPLENADLIGLDLTAQIHEVVLPHLSVSTAPSAGLMQRLAAGAAGVKSGAGFYDGWTADKVEVLRSRLKSHLAMLLAEDEKKP